LEFEKARSPHLLREAKYPGKIQETGRGPPETMHFPKQNTMASPSLSLAAPPTSQNPMVLQPLELRTPDCLAAVAPVTPIWPCRTFVALSCIVVRHMVHACCSYEWGGGAALARGALAKEGDNDGMELWLSYRYMHMNWTRVLRISHRMDVCSGLGLNPSKWV
jgi:hypothetical protein